MRILKKFEGHSVVAHNMNFGSAAFGCEDKMAMLLLPLKGFLSPNHKASRVLIVGPRTEDDISWARSIGLHQARGLDLFTCSPLTGLGDAHQTSYPDHTFDAIVPSWIHPCIVNLRQVLYEMVRIIRPGRLIGPGWHYLCDASKCRNEHGVEYLNTLYNVECLVSEIGENIICAFDSSAAEHDHNKVILFKTSIS